MLHDFELFFQRLYGRRVAGVEAKDKESQSLVDWVSLVEEFSTVEFLELFERCFTKWLVCNGYPPNLLVYSAVESVLRDEWLKVPEVS